MDPVWVHCDGRIEAVKNAPFAPCVRALRNSASECGGRAVMCMGYETRCVQKRVPGVFSRPKGHTRNYNEYGGPGMRRLKDHALSFGFGHCSRE
jgi:hypothetical protein